jgi:hypothetical protein
MNVELLQHEIDASFIFQMREMKPADLDAADAKLDRARASVSIVGHRESGLFEIYEVSSGSKQYTVIRLGYFVVCPCGDFKFSGSCCKHALVTFPQVCRACFETPVERRGATCLKCDMESSPYLPPTVERKTESIGGIRF